MKRQRGFILNPFVFVSGGPPPGSDPDFSSTVLLLPGSSPTDDLSAANLTLTNSSVTVTSAETKFGPTSLRFAGAESLTHANFAGFRFQTDTTAELDFRADSVATACLLEQRSPGTGDGWGLFLAADGSFFLQGTGGFLQTSPSIYTAATWYHLAVTLSGSTVRLFLDGNLEATGTPPIGNETGASFKVGQRSTGSNSYIGYLENIRMTTVARYTASFTPPSAPYPTS